MRFPVRGEKGNGGKGARAFPVIIIPDNAQAMNARGMEAS